MGDVGGSSMRTSNMKKSFGQSQAKEKGLNSELYRIYGGSRNANDLLQAYPRSSVSPRSPIRNARKIGAGLSRNGGRSSVLSRVALTDQLSQIGIDASYMLRRSTDANSNAKEKSNSRIHLTPLRNKQAQSYLQSTPDLALLKH